MRFRGEPGFGGPLDGVQTTLQEAWNAEKWQELADNVNRADWVGDQLRPNDVYIQEELSVADFVSAVERKFEQE